MIISNPIRCFVSAISVDRKVRYVALNIYASTFRLIDIVLLLCSLRWKFPLWGEFGVEGLRADGGTLCAKTEALKDSNNFG